MLYKLVNQSRWFDCFQISFQFSFLLYGQVSFANGASLSGINLKI